MIELCRRFATRHSRSGVAQERCLSNKIFADVPVREHPWRRCRTGLLAGRSPSWLGLPDRQGETVAWVAHTRSPVVAARWSPIGISPAVQMPLPSLRWALSLSGCAVIPVLRRKHRDFVATRLIPLDVRDVRREKRTPALRDATAVSVLLTGSCCTSFRGFGVLYDAEEKLLGRHRNSQVTWFH